MKSYQRFFTFLLWALPAPLCAAVTGLALMDGIEHPWLSATFVVSVLTAPLAVLFSLGLCLVLMRRLQKREEEFLYANDSFDKFKEKNRLLEEEVNKLSGLREIHMSAHIESFSDLLKSTLNITQVSIGSVAHTLYLESRDQVGSLYPKAHMRWRLGNERGIGYFFFEEEIILTTLEEEAIGAFALRDKAGEQGLLQGDLIHGGRQVGSFEAEPQSVVMDREGLKHFVQDFSMVTKGALHCWQSRSSYVVEYEGQTLMNVPIFSQGIIIGVLQTEFEDRLDGGEIRKAQVNLNDFSRNFGQSLRKEQLYEQAIKDAMTGLFNKAQYAQQLHDHFHRCMRYQRALTYIFLDIDHFKNINDSYGHGTGDMALKGVARIMQENIRQSDIAFRFGGEELCVLLPESTEEEGVAVAEKLRSKIEATAFPTDQEGKTIHFTASFGVACTHRAMMEPIHLEKAADDAVYHAKKTGRNRVVLASQLPKNRV